VKAPHGENRRDEEAGAKSATQKDRQKIATAPQLSRKRP